MKKIWIVEIKMFNGTGMLGNTISAFSTKELAEKTKQKLQELNSNSNDTVKVSITIREVDYYESESEIPILNNKV